MEMQDEHSKIITQLQLMYFIRKKSTIMEVGYRLGYTSLSDYKREQ